MVTGTDLVCDLRGRRPAPGPPPPQPSAPAAASALGRAAAGRTLGRAGRRRGFGPLLSRTGRRRRHRETAKTATFVKWLGILADKEIAVYLNDTDARIVYRKGISLDLMGTSGKSLPSRSPICANCLQDLRFGARTLAKTPRFTIVAILVLALGIGANSAMFTLVNALLIKPLAGKADELVGLYSHDRTKPESSYRGFAYANYVDIRDGNDVFESLMAHTFTMVGVPNGDSTRQTFVAVVSSNYFETLGAPLAAGRAFTREEERPSARIPVAIVNHEHAALLGQTIKINAIDFTVVGVAPRDFTGTMALISPEMWLPLGMFDVVVNDIFKNNGGGLADRRNLSLVLAGRLKPGLTVASAAPRLDALSRQLERAYPAENKEQLLTVNPLPRLGTSTSPSSDAGRGRRGGVPDGALGRGPADRVPEHRQHAAGARRVAAQGDRDPARGRRRARADRPAAADRGAAARARRRRRRPAARVVGHGRCWRARWPAVMPLGIAFEPKPDAMVVAATTAFAVIATVIVGPRSRAEAVEDRPRRGPEGAGRRRIAGARAPLLGAQRDGGRPDRAVADAALGRRAVRARRAEGGVGQSRLQLRPAAAGRHRSDAGAVPTRRAGARAIASVLGAGPRAARRRGRRHGGDRCRSAISTRDTRSSASAARRVRTRRPRVERRLSHHRRTTISGR